MFPEATQTFEAAFVEYIAYVEKLIDGLATDDFKKMRSPKELLELATDPKGYPVLPPPGEKESLDVMKHLIRSFVSAHYRKTTFPPYNAF